MRTKSPNKNRRFHSIEVVVKVIKYLALRPGIFCMKMEFPRLTNICIIKATWGHQIKKKHLGIVSGTGTHITTGKDTWVQGLAFINYSG